MLECAPYRDGRGNSSARSQDCPEGTPGGETRRLGRLHGPEAIRHSQCRPDLREGRQKWRPSSFSRYSNLVGRRARGGGRRRIAAELAGAANTRGGEALGLVGRCGIAVEPIAGRTIAGGRNAIGRDLFR